MSSYKDPEETGAAVAAVDDVDMAEAAADEQVGDDAAPAEAETAADEGEETGEAAAAEEEREVTPVPTRTSFATYLSSPVVTLVVGGGDSAETAERMQLTAHQGLLTQSPYFATLCAELGEVNSI